MMLFNNIDDNGREFIVFGEFDAFGYVTFDDDGAHGGISFEVGIDA